MTKRTKKNLSDDTVLSEETFTYDAAGNVTNANGETAQYSLNNRIMLFNNSGVGCDLDGNLTSLHFDSGWMDLTYDSKNRLTSAGGHTYTYDAEDVRIRNLCGDVDTTYAYDTNGKLSRLLMKTTNGVTTKYVYGLGLIGEQTGNSFKYYHFDSRGSTVAITGGTGIVMDTFEYDTYGKLTSHTGNNEVIFGYNGRDGVVTDANGLLYMRARYYSPEMRRFVNADILPGGISEAITLNRYAYANGNPVSFVDPFGLKGMSNHHERVGDYVPYGSAEQIYLIDELLNALAGISQSTDANSQKQTDSPQSLWADDVEGDSFDEKIYEFCKTEGEYYLLLLANPGKLPTTGEADTSQELLNPDGTVKQKRWYGPNGNAIRDRDYNHPGEGIPFPHDHTWQNGKRGKDHLPPSPEYEFSLEPLAGAGLLFLCLLATAIIAADDITGVGAANDFLLAPISGVMSYSLGMIAG